MFARISKGTVRLVVIAVAGALGGAAVAYAAIPDRGGVIHACYQKTTGALRVVDSEKDRGCTRAELGLVWNQTGPQGVAGAQGPAGPQGVAGPQGPAGPAGSARAFISFGQNGSGASKNVTSVEDLTHGLYCVLLDPSIDLATTAPIVTPAAGTGFGALMATVVPAGCSTSRTGIQVQIWNSSGVGVQGGFDLVVP